MEKTRALNTAIELTNTFLASSDLKIIPNKETAEKVANFIEALATRLEKMGESD